jgi:hypothetical protein
MHKSCISHLFHKLSKTAPSQIMMRVLNSRSMKSVGIEPSEDSVPRSGDCNITSKDNELYSDTGFHYTAARFLQATSESRRSGKPILMLLADDCDSTTDEFSFRVLPHPLLREAADTQFVTVLVDTQATLGNDAALIQKYYTSQGKKHPVGWIMDYRGRKLAPQIANHSVENVSKAMIKALKSSKNKVPEYLDLVFQESSAVEESAVFGMSCYNDGEILFSRIEGVIATCPGQIGAKPCVKVAYDTKKVSYRKLVRIAIRQNAADVIYCRNSKEQRIAKEAKRTGKGKFTMVGMIYEAMRPAVNGADKHFLSKTSMCRVPLTRLQKLKANLRISENKSCLYLLSSRQRFMLEIAEENKQVTTRRRCEPRAPEWIDFFLRGLVV